MVKVIVALALVAMVAVNSASAFGGFGYESGLASAVPAAAATMDAGRAVGHAAAAENRATDAMMDRVTGNPIGAAINEHRAMSHSIASNVAATKSGVEAGLANSMASPLGAGLASPLGAGLANPIGAAVGANYAANAASRAAFAGAGAGAYGPYSGAYGSGYGYPGAYGAAYGYPYQYNSFMGPLGYGAGTGRALAGGAAAATGAALANGIAGAALGTSAAGINAGMGAVSRFAALA